MNRLREEHETEVIKLKEKHQEENCQLEKKYRIMQVCLCDKIGFVIVFVTQKGLLKNQKVKYTQILRARGREADYLKDCIC